MKFKRFIVVASVGFVAFGIGWISAAVHFARRVDRIVAMSWGDGRYGPAFYGAQVYLEPLDSGYSVRALVHIGRGNDMFHDFGEIGRAQSDADAVARWGTIDWREDGLHIGSGTNEYFLPRAKVESHR